MLTYQHSNHLELVAYFGFDFNGCMDNNKSTLGYIYLLTNSVVSCSIKQFVVASSTVETEFITCYEATS